jgi:hypothetical protein
MFSQFFFLITAFFSLELSCAFCHYETIFESRMKLGIRVRQKVLTFFFLRIISQLNREKTTKYKCCNLIVFLRFQNYLKEFKLSKIDFPYSAVSYLCDEKFPFDI